MTLEAGVQVDVDWPGRREPLPADIDLSAFRIIREAVTNVLPCRHQPVPGLDRPAGRVPVDRGYRQRARRPGQQDQSGRDRLRDHRHARARHAARRRLLGWPAPRRWLPRHRPAASAHALPMTIRVILADGLSGSLVCAGLRMLIEQTPDIDVAGEAGTGAEAVQLARNTASDVVVIESHAGHGRHRGNPDIIAGETRARVLMPTS